MENSKQVVDSYLRNFLAGESEDAFHGLIELGSEIIEELISVYEATADLSLRLFVVKVVSEFRVESSIDFLGGVLNQDEAQLWKSSLDGLASLNSNAAINEMKRIIASVSDAKTEKRAWIQEAISDTKQTSQNR